MSNKYSLLKSVEFPYRVIQYLSIGNIGFVHNLIGFKRVIVKQYFEGISYM